MNTIYFTNTSNLNPAANTSAPVIFGGQPAGSYDSYVGMKSASTAASLIARAREEADPRSIFMLPFMSLNKVVDGGLRNGQVSILCGPPGVAKSYFCLNLLHTAVLDDASPCLLPLEDTAGDWALRLLAVACKDWDIVSLPRSNDLNERRDHAAKKEAILKDNTNRIDAWFRDGIILENPWMPVARDGVTDVRAVPWQDVVSFVESAIPNHRLIIVDNISQIVFDPSGRDEYKEQGAFLRKLLAVLSGTKCHVLLVAHTTKVVQKGAYRSAECVMGSSMLSRLSHNVFSLVREDPPRRSHVYTPKEYVEHNMTFNVIKCRNGHSGQSIAFSLDTNGPVFQDLGLIKPEKSRAKNPAAVVPLPVPTLPAPPATAMQPTTGLPVVPVGPSPMSLVGHSAAPQQTGVSATETQDF